MRDLISRYVNHVRVNGRDYYYHRKTRERLPDEPNARALRVLEINKCLAAGPSRPADGTVAAVVAEYRQSAPFKQLADSTRRNYIRDLDRIVETWGRLSIKGVERKHCLKFRDKLGETPRTANHLASVMSLLFAFAIDRGYRKDNPAARIGRLKTAKKSRPWSNADWSAFARAAPPEMALAGAVALYTGQRQGDVLRMRWGDIQDGAIRIVQGKTDAELVVPLHKDLAAILQGVEKRAVHIVTDARGRPYVGRSDTFRHDWRAATLAAGLDGLTFHGLRHTAATKLAEAGCSDMEIAAITGHKSPAMVRRYTDKANQGRLAKAAIKRLETGEND